MNTWLSMILLGILFFIAMRSSSSLPFEADDYEPNANYPTGIIDYKSVHWQSKYDWNEANIADQYKSCQQWSRTISTTDATSIHNQYRARHCAPPLTLDTNLNNEAQQYSQYLISTSKFEHSYVEEDENLTAKYSSGRITSYSGKNLFSSISIEIDFSVYSRSRANRCVVQRSEAIQLQSTWFLNGNRPFHSISLEKFTTLGCRCCL